METHGAYRSAKPLVTPVQTSRAKSSAGVCYYHDRVTISLDNDNLVKPIQDALNGLVYDDDRQVTDTQLRKTCLDGAFRVRGLSPLLALAFQAGAEFLHVSVTEVPSHEILLS